MMEDKEGAVSRIPSCTMTHFTLYCNMLESLYQYLHQNAGLTKEEFRKLEPYFEIRHFGKGAYLVDKGEMENFVHFIVEGLVRKFFRRKTAEVTTQLAREADMVSSAVSFLTGKPSEYVVEALESTTTISITKINMEKVYKIGPRMDRLGRLVTTDWLLQKEKWDIDSVLLTPKDRFIAFVQNNPDLVKRVPQKYLASYLNITPETFSRFKRFIP